MRKNNLYVLILFVYPFLLPAIASGQQKDWNSSEIKLGLKKLQELSSVLYIAAHPDDENTRLISYLANDQLSRTAYLSITRGDGGQNLVGTEKGSQMGVLRTQELLEARKIDGGEQFFTRAVDFGYSKTPEETFTKWDRDQVLADVVWTIRKFRPDIIVTRFPPTQYAGHGHHSASAIIAAEAFKLAADPKAYPEQLKQVEIWQVKRHFFNSSTWWDKELETKAVGNDSIFTVDIGKYNPLLGKSYSEIASESRSMHKSQGFGSAKQRGTKNEYLIIKQGAMPKTRDIFEGITRTWSDLDGGKEIGEDIGKIVQNFDPEQPALSVIPLVKLYAKINSTLKDGYWKVQKQKEVKELILACSGIWMEASANRYFGVPSENMVVTASVINRNGVDVQFKKFSVAGKDTSFSSPLPTNEMRAFTTTIKLSDSINTNPYWMNAPFEGMYKVLKQHEIGVPANANQYPVTFSLNFGSTYPELTYVRPLIYKWTDPVKGEIYRDFIVLPTVTANIADPVYIFSNHDSQEVKVTLRCNTDSAQGKILLDLPKEWKSSPKSIPFFIKGRSLEQVFTFMISSPKNEQVGEMKVILEENNIQRQAKSFVEINYDHVPKQVLLPEATSKIVKLNVLTYGKSIGYIPGAGDEVPAALEQLGYTVQILDESNINNVNLENFDAIVTGIRAYNTQPFLKNVKNLLMEYVKQGGNVIVQYNTSHALVTEDIGPYPLKLSRDRVTVEEAVPTFLYPNHALLNAPNTITRADFVGWVQERGLYFPNEWDQKYIPIISWNDPGEEEKKGALLVGKYGEGNFIYTGISFFRELPAGVPGAYKLFANMISLGKQ